MVIFDFTDSFTAFMCTTGRQDFLLLTKYLNMYAKLREQHPQDEETLKRRPRKNKQSHGTPFFSVSDGSGLSSASTGSTAQICKIPLHRK